MGALSSFFAAFEPFFRFDRQCETWSSLSVGVMIPAKRIQLASTFKFYIHEGVKVKRSMIFWCSKTSKKNLWQALKAIHSQSGHHWINDTSASAVDVFFGDVWSGTVFVESKIPGFYVKKFIVKLRNLQTFTIDTQILQWFHSKFCSWRLSTYHPVSKHYVLNLAVSYLVLQVDMRYISKFAHPPKHLLLLMAEIPNNQLRLVVYPIIYRVSAPSQVVSRISAINSSIYSP